MSGGTAELLSREERHSLRGILDANYHKGGLKCRHLFQVESGFFARLAEEAEALVRKYDPSRVTAGHVTNWTKPFGTAIQFSLLNESGKFDDFSTDHNRVRAGKRFHYAESFPTMARFIDALPSAYNMRLNGMGKKSGLSPHEEHVVFRSADGSSAHLRARFHLPLRTSTKAEMLLDGDVYNFKAGSIYFFNNGCVHSATNTDETFRYHLVWDALLTKRAFDAMFVDTPSAAFLSRVPASEAECSAIRHVNVTEYQTSGEGRRIYDEWHLKRLMSASAWQNLYNRYEFFQMRRLPIAWCEERSVSGQADLYGHDIRD